ncbi:MAG: zinc ribbon domain-containing protein, partial [Blastocatellia bacterium]|nr:zinc ribbon domain-containing protein [Blastocatellia bacterium]
MFCPTCGKDNPHEQRFCARCGTNLETVSMALSG